MKRKFIIMAITVIGMGGVMTSATIPTAVAGSEITGNETAQNQAGQQTSTFSIEKMTCAMCPITVRKAMERVEGVKSVKVDYDSKTAVVVFDPAVATADAIAAASSNVGYPATQAR